MADPKSLIKPEKFAMDSAALLAWYDANARELPWRVDPGRRKQGVLPDPYRVFVSEIMLQQTGVVTVGDYFTRFLKRWPRVGDLAAAPLEEVLAQWAGLGYYARARNLHKAARVVAFEHKGIFPQSARQLQELPGIGPYTGAAIAAICYDEKIAVLDGNVERILARLMALPRPVRAAKAELRTALGANVPGRAGDFAQAMMDLGASLCAPRAAACSLCPLRADCRAALLPDPTLFPLKPVKAQKPVRFGHAFVLERRDGAIWLKKRADKGLLAQMTEVPGTDWLAERQPPLFPLAGKWQDAGEVSHVFTHFRLELKVWRLQNPAEPMKGPGWWCAADDLADQALPTLFRKVLASVPKK